MAKILGIDLGSSSIEAAIIDAETFKVEGRGKSPQDIELEIIHPSGNMAWAEQNPYMWNQHLQQAVHNAATHGGIDLRDIGAVGIAYQMHGAVPINVDSLYVRDAIIWCDTRTNEIKERFEVPSGLSEMLLRQNLNLPGHFTASKIRWIMENEPEVWEKVDKVLLPGHYIAQRATGQATVTPSGLSEGALWNFSDMKLSDTLMDHFDIEDHIIPEIVGTFGEHGEFTKKAAKEWGLSPGTKITYLAGDQPNNAFAVNVLEPGEVAAAGGTSGVLFGITDGQKYDPACRINQFLAVNSSIADHSNLRIGALACINGAGITYRFMRDILGGKNYRAMDSQASSDKAIEQAKGILFVPYGNGGERTQLDTNKGATITGLQYGMCEGALYRAALEGIAFAMKVGADAMTETGVPIKRVKVARAGLFTDRLFIQIFADALGVPIEVYKTNGAAGAARGAAVGYGASDIASVNSTIEHFTTMSPRSDTSEKYEQWKELAHKVSTQG